MIADDPLSPQAVKGDGEAAALDTEVVGQLLLVKGNQKVFAPLEGGLLREVGEKLFAGGALGQMADLAVAAKAAVLADGARINPPSFPA